MRLTLSMFKKIEKTLCISRCTWNGSLVLSSTPTEPDPDVTHVAHAVSKKTQARRHRRCWGWGEGRLREYCGGVEAKSADSARGVITKAVDEPNNEVKRGTGFVSAQS